jgi:RNA polymerase sigma-70 factor (ECF subfamily)
MNLPSDGFTERLRSYVRRRVATSSDADDVVQTALLRLLESEAVSSDSSAQAWLLAAARNAIADHHRARARSGEPLTEPEAVPGTEPDEASDITECLAPVLAALAEDDRALLRRVDVEGDSQAELARELGLSVSGLKSRVQRARERLRKAVIARCEFERDRSGRPVGPATCRPRAAEDSCACDREPAGDRDCG